MSKLILRDLGPIHTAWIRHASAFVAYLAAVSWLRFKDPFLVPKRGKDWILVIALGFCAFTFTSLTQMNGLNASTATENVLIIAMEPLITAIMAAIFLRERIGKAGYLSFAVALAGFALLTDLTPARMVAGFDSHLIGNLLMLSALLGEASYSIFARKLMERHGPFAVFGMALTCGFSILSLIVFFKAGFPDLTKLTGPAMLAVLWIGPLGTTATYLYWMFALSEAPVATIALTLFVQPVLGAVWGIAFLRESLTLVQALGGVMILFAVLWQSRSPVTPCVSNS